MTTETQIETESTEKDAQQFWGYLLKPDKCGTELLNRFLSGVADYITTNIEPSDCPDLDPSQLAAFYRAVGGNYDILFADTPPSSIAFIYKSLGCLHSVQPTPDDDGYTPPSVPCLKARGFVTWQTIQLLLGPEEHVPFLQKAVAKFDILDPESGEPFPKILPKNAFPEKPDQAMLDWYESVSEKLRFEAESEAAVDPQRGSLPATESADGSGDERFRAARYFSNPLYRDHDGRPAIVRAYSRVVPRSQRQILEDRGKAVVGKVRHFWHPDAHRRRRSLPERHSDDSHDERPSPTGSHTRYGGKAHRQHGPSSLHPTDSESDHVDHIDHAGQIPSRHRRSSRDRSPRQERSPALNKPSDGATSPTLRHHRSHESDLSPRSSPQEYFPKYRENERQSSIPPRAEVGGFAPSKAPPFAAQIAQMQPSRISPRDAVPEVLRGTYSGRPTVRYSRRSIEPIEEKRPMYSHEKRARARDEYERRSRSHDKYDRYEREQDRSPPHRYVEGTKGRRYPVDPLWQA